MLHDVSEINSQSMNSITKLSKQDAQKQSRNDAVERNQAEFTSF